MKGKPFTFPVTAMLVVMLVALPINAGARGTDTAPGQQPPTSSIDPSITGTALDGQTLTANAGDWSGVSVTYSYQWQQCNTSGDECSPVDGAVDSTYALSSSDVGSTLRVVVTVSNKNGSASAVSAASGVVGPVPAPAPSPQPTPPPTTTPTTTTPTTTTTPATTTTTTTPTTTSTTPSASVASDGPWYSSASAFNKPIPASPPIYPNSASMLTTWAPQGTNTWNSYWLGPRGGPGLGAAPAVAYPTSSTPNVTVQINFPGSCSAGSPVTVAIPSGTDVGTGNSENKLTVMLPNGEEWDFFDITPPNTATFNYTNEGGPASCAPNGNWQALEAVKHSPGWTGSGSTSAQWSDSNIPFGAGIIRKRDIVNTPAGGNWGHALMIDYSNNCARTGAPHPGFVYPATTSDG